jgi:hypothetical protein
MICFMNERSVGQYGDLGASLAFFLAAAQELSLITADLFKDSAFFFGPNFKQRFGQLGIPKDQRALILELVFGQRYYRCWRPERVSASVDRYAILAPQSVLHDQSICEATERALANAAASPSLLSAPDSDYGQVSPIRVTKISSNQVSDLENTSSIGIVRQWIAAQPGYYAVNSPVSPKDFQTVLQKAPQRFRRTGKTERRFQRQIFEETATGWLYHVDDGHAGHSAHLEVFSARRVHLGTAHINTGALDPAQRINGRILRN